jgi:hypothetical protein
MIKAPYLLQSMVLFYFVIRGLPGYKISSNFNSFPDNYR